MESKNIQIDHASKWIDQFKDSNGPWVKLQENNLITGRFISPESIAEAQKAALETAGIYKNNPVAAQIMFEYASVILDPDVDSAAYSETFHKEMDKMLGRLKAEKGTSFKDRINRLLLKWKKSSPEKAQSLEDRQRYYMRYFLISTRDEEGDLMEGDKSTEKNLIISHLVDSFSGTLRYNKKLLIDAVRISLTEFNNAIRLIRHPLLVYHTLRDLDLRNESDVLKRGDIDARVWMLAKQKLKKVLGENFFLSYPDFSLDGEKTSEFVSRTRASNALYNKDFSHPVEETRRILYGEGSAKYMQINSALSSLKTIAEKIHGGFRTFIEKRNGFGKARASIEQAIGRGEAQNYALQVFDVQPLIRGKKYDASSISALIFLNERGEIRNISDYLPKGTKLAIRLGNSEVAEYNAHEKTIYYPPLSDQTARLLLLHEIKEAQYDEEHPWNEEQYASMAIIQQFLAGKQIELSDNDRKMAKEIVGKEKWCYEEALKMFSEWADDGFKLGDGDFVASIEQLKTVADLHINEYQQKYSSILPKE